MEISQMQSHQIKGFTPYIELMKKINEMIKEINLLNEKICELERNRS